MPSAEIDLALHATQSAFGLYGAVYIVTSIVTPSWFLDTIAVNTSAARYARKHSHGSFISRNAPWWSMPFTFFTFVAVGVLIYAAIYAVVSIVPQSWGGTDEDGDWYSAKYALQAIGALFGAIGLPIHLEKNAEILVWAPLERKARRELQEAIRSAGYSAPEILESVRERVDAKLVPEPNMPKGFRYDWQEGLHRVVTSELQRHVR